MSDFDWTTLDGCSRCNEHGPYLPAGVFYNPEASRDFHQAWHGFVAAYLAATHIPQFVEWLNRRYG